MKEKRRPDSLWACLKGDAELLCFGFSDGLSGEFVFSRKERKNKWLLCNLGKRRVNKQCSANNFWKSLSRQVRAFDTLEAKSVRHLISSEHHADDKGETGQSSNQMDADRVVHGSRCA